MTIGGSFLKKGVFRGGAQSARPSSYYIGYWPGQQAAGDSDETQVTDRSGNDAHMGLQSLSVAQAWANAGYVSSVAGTSLAPLIPLAKWPHRYSTDSLIVAAQQIVTKGGSTIRFAGNANGTLRGINICVTATGSIQPHVVGSTTAFGLSSVTAPYSSAVLRTWVLAYDAIERSISMLVDGAMVRDGDTTVAASVYDTIDSAPSGFCFGGQPAGTSLATQAKHMHAIYFPGKGLPTNLLHIAHRLHVHPRLMLRDQDFKF